MFKASVVKLLALSLILSLCTLSSVLSQTLDIPDAKFRAALLQSGYDLDADGYISPSEAAKIERLEVSGLALESLKGIESFTNLRYLNAGQNELTSVDLSGLERLEDVYLFKNKLDSLRLRGCRNLRTLDVWGSVSLGELDLQGLTSLRRLDCYSTGIQKLDLRGLARLQKVDAQESFLKELILGDNDELEKLNVRRSYLEFAQLTEAPNLVEADLSRNRLAYLDIRGLEKLRSVDIDNNPLVILKMGGNMSLLRMPF